MKKLYFILSLMFVCFLANAQDTTNIEAFSLTTISDAVKLFISYVNWLYILTFMLVCWLINDTTDANNVATWLNWFNKIPKAIRTLAIGFILIIAYAWVFQLHGRFEFFKLVVSLLTSMVIYKFGINKIFSWLSARLGLKFDN